MSNFNADIDAAIGSDDSPVFTLSRGQTPLLVSMPHDGTAIPESIAQRMTERALRRPDTDWHVARLYEFATALGASTITPRYSRYVVDLNRSAENTALYPGTDNTDVCPTTCFDNTPIYAANQAPEPSEVEARINRYWQPYHNGLAAELTRLRERYEIAVLFDAHSIASIVPRFFDAELPHLNLGTADGHSCAPELQQRLAAVLTDITDYTHVVNGRFKGGYITRHYGRPQESLHAVQLELAQRSYMDEAYPYHYDDALAAQVQPVLRRLLSTMLEWVATSN